MQGLDTLARRALYGRRNQYECVTCGLAFDSNRTDCPACGGRITRWTTDSEGTP
jgi:rRNA maturation endonuclease Nob1